MRKHFLQFLLILLSLSLAACQGQAAIADETIPIEEATGSGGILISEVLAGVEGNNNYDFIELYNVGQAPFDLSGYSLYYKLNDDQLAELVYAWDTSTLVPPQSHYLLGRSGETFAVETDASFDVSLVPARGSLSLRTPQGEAVDSLGWGSTAEMYTESVPASAMDKGVSLERKPGGTDGNATDSDQNAADFSLNEIPNPQNSGSPTTPTPEQSLVISVQAPQTAEPGSEFDYLITVENATEQTLEDVEVAFSIPEALTVSSLPEDMTLDENLVIWGVGTLANEEARSATITVTAPLTQTQVMAHSYFVQAGPLMRFGGPLRTSIEGGSLPVEVARGLLDTEVTVEGIATMYTGGFYAGSGNKFYLEDESGGVQVYVSGSSGQINVPLGALVRVTGVMQLYRGALEIVPDAAEKVEVLEAPKPDTSWEPTVVDVNQAANEMDALPGLLVQVDGTIARVEEFSYSYEIDLVDDEGQLLTVYIDKLTNINVETIESGQQYRVTGIVDVLDANQRLYPRLQSDLVEIFPPVLLVEAQTQTTAQPDEVYTVTITAFNHTADAMTEVRIAAPIPGGAAMLENVSEGGIIEGEHIVWEIAELAGNGESASVSFQVRAGDPAEGYVLFDDFQASAAQWSEPVTGTPLYTFIGSSVPIWAIQGAGSRSPYLLEEVTTSGVVTGVFPELEGFWIQETTSDDDPATSSGLFIFTAEQESTLSAGDLVEVTGTVREAFQQTQLVIASSAEVQVLGQGNTLPQAIELDPPVAEEEAASYYEALEGMLVQVSNTAIAVSPTNRYGEYALVLPKHEKARLYQGEDNGMAIMVDDGSMAAHLDASTLAYTVTTGDQVSNLVGPLAFTFGNYKIEPIHPPDITAQDTTLPSLPPTGADEFSIMTWNVENLFDIRDPHPSSPPLPSLAQYKLDIAKVANTILAAGAPTIIGLQEVENIGILEDIAEHELLAAYSYQPALIEGTDGRGIDVGYLVRGDRADILEVQQHTAPEGLTSRPPLLIEVAIEAEAGVATVYVINNHFTSMSGGEQATEPRRSAQAAWNVTVAELVLTNSPDAYLAIIGDLNSYYHSQPIDTLREAGFKHVFEAIEEEERYNYIYQGVSQTLDHILVTPLLMGVLQRVEVLHTNADFPPPDPGDDSPQRKSDHDPVIATFALQP